MSLSTTKLGDVRGSQSQTVPAGGTLPVSFAQGVDAGTWVHVGAAYWGVPGSALDLPLTIDADGNVVLPEDDAIYDLRLRVKIGADAADVGKMVGLLVTGNDVAAHTVWSPVRPDHSCDLTAQWTDRLFLGDGPQPVTVTVIGEQLTVAAPLMFPADLTVTKRP